MCGIIAYSVSCGSCLRGGWGDFGVLKADPSMRALARKVSVEDKDYSTGIVVVNYPGLCQC